MIRILTERAFPPGFDPMDDGAAARHCRIAVDAMASLGRPFHWLGTAVTEDRLFGLQAVESEADVQAYWRAAGTSGQAITVHAVRRVIGPWLAAEPSR